MIRSLAFAALAGAVQAQEVVTTARSAPPPALAAAPAPADADNKPADLTQVVLVGPCTPGAEEIAREAREQGATVKVDHAMHGQVSAGIGTGGYRHVDATVCKPIGDKSSVTVSIGDTRMNHRRRY